MDAENVGTLSDLASTSPVVALALMLSQGVLFRDVQIYKLNGLSDSSEYSWQGRLPLSDPAERVDKTVAKSARVSQHGMWLPWRNRKRWCVDPYGSILWCGHVQRTPGKTGKQRQGHSTCTV
eukprot:symbB.v1.2.033286.t1/scaffold4113.1/size46942/3